MLVIAVRKLRVCDGDSSEERGLGWGACVAVSSGGCGFLLVLVGWLVVIVL